MADTSVIDKRLQIAYASLKGYRRRGDILLVDFWEEEVDRLLDQRSRATAKQTQEVNA